jgi:hypothetical protein
MLTEFNWTIDSKHRGCGVAIKIRDVAASVGAITVRAFSKGSENLED